MRLGDIHLGAERFAVLERPSKPCSQLFGDRQLAPPAARNDQARRTAAMRAGGRTVVDVLSDDLVVVHFMIIPRSRPAASKITIDDAQLADAHAFRRLKRSTCFSAVFKLRASLHRDIYRSAAE